jgi:hypothetical protein
MGPGGLFDEKTEGRISRDTVPLRFNIRYIPVVILKWDHPSVLSATHPAFFNTL